jgi:hypothetical protein
MKRSIFYLILFLYFLNPLFADEITKYNISIDGIATNGTDIMISVYIKPYPKTTEILYNGRNFKRVVEFPINKSELFNSSRINFKPKDWNYYSYFTHPVVVGYFKGKWIFYNPEVLGFFNGKNFTATISGFYSGCSTARISKFKSSDDIAFIIWRGSTAACNGNWLCAYYNLPGKNIFPYNQGYYGIAYNPKEDFWYIYYFNDFWNGYEYNITNNSIYIWKNGKIIKSFNLSTDKMGIFGLYHLNYQPMECDNNGDLLIPLTSPPKYYSNAKINYSVRGLYLYNGKDLIKISNITPYILCRGDKGVLMVSDDGFYMYNNKTITKLPNFEFKDVNFIVYANKYWLITGIGKDNAIKLVKFDGNHTEDLTQQLVDVINGKNEINYPLYGLIGAIFIIVYLLKKNLMKNN